MDIFAQKKFLVWMVVLLTILNVFSIGIFFWKDFSRHQFPPPFPPPPPPHHEFRDVSGILKTELSLTDKQVEQIKTLRADIFEKERDILTTLRSQRDSMNSEMFNKATDEELVKSLAKRISENEYSMEMLRFEQAKQLKAICTPEQLEKFGDLVIEIRDYFRPDNQPRRK